MVTIQERIAALNQAHIERAPGAFSSREIKPDLPGPRPPISERDIPNANHDPRSSYTSVKDHIILPPPTITRAGQKVPTPPQRPKKSPPPLPARKATATAQLPPLPQRKSSDISHRRNSGDSSISTPSISANSTTSTGNGRSPPPRSISSEKTATCRLAPEWGEISLPPLPPKRNGNINGNQTLRSQSSVGGLDSDCQPSSTSVLSVAQKLPIRSTSSYANGLPPLPSRKSANDDFAKPPQLPQRKIPQPVPPSSALEKIKASSFATIKKHSTSHEPVTDGCEYVQQANGSAPPVPIRSRPDLSKIQATKPRIPLSPAPVTGSSDLCMICRDFSGPDNHAAKFPRQSLPTNDLARLANQLTAPFPSLTDKARAIFTWLHHNIDYNVDAFFNNNLTPSTPDSTFATGLAVCEGYAELFERLATFAGLEARIISGHGKGYGYTPLPPGSPIPPYNGNHAWNVVRIDNGRWKLIDACWGSGNVRGKGQPYNKEFTPEYFTMTNDEFGNKHFPSNPSDFYRDDGRPCISWEEYMSINPSMPNGVEPPIIYTGVKAELGIGEKTLQPRSKKISIHQQSPIRFQFGLLCEHWTLARSNMQTPYLFILMANGIDGRNKEYLPFHYVRGSGPGAGGDIWYLDVPNPRILGAPGQKLHIYRVTSFGDMRDTQGLTREEFLRGIGRVAMGFGGVAEWELI
ncbi:hypothetical protein GX48_00743 [Paracoccidioides brasiliensis]|nr:hypothetical protein GX48_00743 [Paracoccidioides brasiliensis]